MCSYALEDWLCQYPVDPVQIPSLAFSSPCAEVPSDRVMRLVNKWNPSRGHALWAAVKLRLLIRWRVNASLKTKPQLIFIELADGRKSSFEELRLVSSLLICSCTMDEDHSLISLSGVCLRSQAVVVCLFLSEAFGTSLVWVQFCPTPQIVSICDPNRTDSCWYFHMWVNRVLSHCTLAEIHVEKEFSILYGGFRNFCKLKLPSAPPAAVRLHE